MWKVKVVHRVSAREIFDTFERFAVKIHRRVVVSCSRPKAFRLLLFADWPEKPGAGNRPFDYCDHAGITHLVVLDFLS